MYYFRVQIHSILSRLLWLDKTEFKRFLIGLVDFHSTPFLLAFLHSFLGSCVDAPWAILPHTWATSKT
jgi:hypothetical protein